MATGGIGVLVEGGAGTPLGQGTRQGWVVLCVRRNGATSLRVAETGQEEPRRREGEEDALIWQAFRHRKGECRSSDGLRALAEALGTPVGRLVLEEGQGRKAVEDIAQAVIDHGPECRLEEEELEVLARSRAQWSAAAREAEERRSEEQAAAASAGEANEEPSTSGEAGTTAAQRTGARNGLAGTVVIGTLLAIASWGMNQWRLGDGWLALEGTQWEARVRKGLTSEEQAGCAEQLGLLAKAVDAARSTGTGTHAGPRSGEARGAGAILVDRRARKVAWVRPDGTYAHVFPMRGREDQEAAQSTGLHYEVQGVAVHDRCTL